MKGILSTTALVCVTTTLLLSEVEGRKKLSDYTPNTFQERHRALEAANKSVTKTSHHRVMDKQFQIPPGDDQKFYYRMDMTPPVLRVGWSTDQAANSKDLSFRLNPSYFQSNPRLGKNTGYGLVAPVTGGTSGSWYLYDVYDLPADTPASGTTPAIPGSKYCVKKGDFGFKNALPTTAVPVEPHMCSSGNVATGATGAQGLQTTLTLTPNQWYSTKAPILNVSPRALTDLVTPVIPSTEYKAWRIPCYPTQSGWCSV